MTGVLYVVATPIGNLNDISSRAVTVLSSVEMIAAEDTRRTRSLLAAIDVQVPKLLALHDHNETSVSARVVATLVAGRAVALVSDAGTPLVSDPGFELVRQCFAEGIEVIPVPGASALLCALSVCPLPTTDFRFLGFLPAKSGPRRSRLAAAIIDGSPFVFFEAPHRMQACLADITKLAADRRLFIGREMTKRHESYLCDLAPRLAQRLEGDKQWRGEFVCVLEGRAGARATADARHTMRVLCREMAPAQAARVGAELLGLKKSELYELALTLKRGK